MKKILIAILILAVCGGAGIYFSGIDLSNILPAQISGNNEEIVSGGGIESTDNDIEELTSGPAIDEPLTKPIEEIPDDEDETTAKEPEKKPATTPEKAPEKAPEKQPEQVSTKPAVEVTPVVTTPAVEQPPKQNEQETVTTTPAIETPVVSTPAVEGPKNETPVEEPKTETPVEPPKEEKPEEPSKEPEVTQPEDPATILVHEGDHAEDDISNPSEHEKRVNIANIQYKNEEEKRVILGDEQKQAIANGECSAAQPTREDHYGTVYDVNDPTKVK